MKRQGANRTALVTGGSGFLGRAAAKRLWADGYRVVGFGHARGPTGEAAFDRWVEGDVSVLALQGLGEAFDIVVHCAGNGSVGYSLTHPVEDFGKTALTTLAVLEYLRLAESRALLIYPSSAGVYGCKEDDAIRETDALAPISPYGHHKVIAEQLLASYSQSYGVRVAIIRFFSVYGVGLTKQLLWDAGAKLLAASDEPAMFWGNGEETRDWINSDDAGALIAAVARTDESYILINGASGTRTTVRHALELLRHALGVETGIAFNDVVRAGDPRHYHADVGRAAALGWHPTVSIEDGISAYAAWLRSSRGAPP